LKSTLDDAVLSHGEVHRELGLPGAYAKVDEIPFDFQRRRMSVVVAGPSGEHQLICKGAIDEVLSVCAFSREHGQDVPLDAARVAALRQEADALANQGLRLVAVAARLASADKRVYAVADERDLVLMGYVAFIDPPKESAGPAIEALRARGVEVKILTGDNEHVTATICREVGVEGERILTGPQIEAMSDEALGVCLRETQVFARLNPAQKTRIVRVLKDAGNVVGFMGDGINDAGALHAADIGISVDTAVDIAREAADIVLLEKSLLVLGEGVIEGRRTLANMDKYIRLTASSNFGNVLSVLVASAVLPFLPMLPLQLLVQNLLYDISQSALPFDRVDEELLARPHGFAGEGLARFMFCFGPLSSVFDLVTFAVLWWGFAANSVGVQALFQSGWFVEGLMSQALVVHMIRTRHLPFLQSRPGWPLAVATVMVLACAVFLPQGPLAAAFSMQPLPGMFFVYLAAVLAVYLLVAQGVKASLIRGRLARSTRQTQG
jgi:Mg2+-importing ATPase